MQFENENVQWLFEQFNEDFGAKGNLNLIVKIDTMPYEQGTGGYDLVVYNVSELDTHLVNDTELSMYCYENGLNEEDFETHRVTLVRMKDYN